MANTSWQLLAATVLIACIGCASLPNGFTNTGKYGVPSTEVEISDVPIAVRDSFIGDRGNRQYRTILKHGDSPPHLYEFYTVEGDGMASECYTHEGSYTGGTL